MSADDLAELSAGEAAKRIGDGEITSLELCEALIRRCEAGRHLNAFASFDWDRLRDDARAADARGKGRLAGIPLVFKDNIDTAGLTTTAGTGALAAFRPGRDAPVAAALFAEGALLGGKGNMHELAFGITNNNAVTGATRNPFDETMIPGGSSGGVAAAVAARMMPAGIGTDTGASVRLPAALCGCVGFRPTVGRYDGRGIVPISHTRDTPGPITRSVADAALIDSILAGEPAAPRRDIGGLRIGVPRLQFFDNLDGEVAEVAERALAILEAEGVELVEADAVDLRSLNARVSAPVALYEFPHGLLAYLHEHGLDMGLKGILDGVGSPDVRAVLASQLADPVPEDVYRRAVGEGRARLRRAYAEYFAGHRLDAAIFPTSPLPARPIGQDDTVELNGRQVPAFEAFIRNTDPASNAGLPAISLPAGLTRAGLPVGLELDAPAGDDRSLLSIAGAIEAVLS